MKIGIYTSGLAQSFAGESVEKYAARFMNEYSYNYTGVTFSMKTEKISYAAEKESTVVTIFKTTQQDAEPVYKFYDFKYHEILTGRFVKYNILLKNLILFMLVVKKFPLLIFRTFRPNGYSHPRQTIYLFGIFLVIASSILFVLPAALSLVTNFFGSEAYRSFVGTLKEILPFTKKWSVDHAFLAKTSQVIVTITALLLIIVPKAKVIVTSLATEFVCANNYLEVGAQSQEILGNLDQLVEYIAEKEPGVKIDYHTYSFGTLVMVDFLFPFGNVPSKNVQQLSASLVTIGAPIEFVKAYYSGYYSDRNKYLDDKLSWMNIYSVSDALSTNFKRKEGKGDAEFGLGNNLLLPFNINYEIVNVKKIGFINALFLYGIKSHGIYWDPSTEGHSCLRLVYNEMNRRQLL